MKKWLLLFFGIFCCCGVGMAQWYSMGVEQRVDPLLINRQQYKVLELVGEKWSREFDGNNSQSFEVVLLRSGVPDIHLVYQTDFWGNLTYMAGSSSLFLIMKQLCFPSLRFQFYTKKIQLDSNATNKILAYLNLLVDCLNACEK
jgi:hypothetical protein